MSSTESIVRHTLHVLDMWRQTVGRSVRVLRHSPWFSMGVVATFALGIATSAFFFALVSGTVGRPLGISNAEEVVSVRLLYTQRGTNVLGLTPRVLSELLAAHHDTFADVAAFAELEAALYFDGRSDVVVGEFVSPEYFSTLGLRPQLGRALMPDDPNDSAEGAVVVSERLWRRRLGARDDIVGQPLRVGSAQVTIVGVLPGEFRGLQLPSIRPSDVYVPLRLMNQVQPSLGAEPPWRNDSWFGLRTVARLQRGVSLPQAQAVADSAVALLARDVERIRDKELVLAPIEDTLMFPGMDRYVRPLVVAVALMGALLLATVCANIAALLMSRLAARQSELAIRRALGASRGRLTALLMTENLLLALAGSALGLLIAAAGGRVLQLAVPSHSLIYMMAVEPAMDGRVIAFAIAVSMACAAAFGLAPSWCASKQNPGMTLNVHMATPSSHRGTGKLRGMFLGVQFFVCTFCVMFAVFFLYAAVQLERRDLGFGNDRAATVSVDLTLHERYDEARGRVFFRRLRETVASQAWADATARTDFLPIGTRRDPADFRLEGEGPGVVDYSRFGNLLRVDPPYFAITRTPLLRGRAFLDVDTDGAAPVAIVSAKTAARLWPGLDPIGQKVQVTEEEPFREVVGVAGDTDVRFIGERKALLIYVPWEQSYSPEGQLLVESSDPPAVVAERVRQMVYTLDPEVAVVNASSLTDWIGLWKWPYRVLAALFSCLAVISVAVALLGAYASSAYSSARATREIGIRLACGSTRAAIVRHMLLRTSRPAFLGILMGAAAAWALAGPARVVFFGLLERNGVFAALVVAAAVSWTIFSALGPVLRALRRGPAEALRAL